MKCTQVTIIYLLFVCAVINAQWVPVNSPRSYESIYTFWVNGNSLIAGASGGIYTSNDNGGSWAEPPTNLKYVRAFIATPTTSGGTNLFAGGLGGVYLSTNGTSWKTANSGLENEQVRSLAISLDVSEEATLFAGTTIGIFRSTNKGISWVKTSLDSGVVIALAVTKDETSRSVILASIYANIYSTSLFRSTDDGSSWTVLPLSNHYWNSIFCFTTIRNETGGTNIFAGTDSGIFLSTDNGTSWIRLDHGPGEPVYSFALSPNGAGGMNFLAGTFNGGVFLSTDSGVSWSAVNTGLTYEDESVDGLAVSENYVFASTHYSYMVWKRPLSEMLASVTSVENSSSVPLHFSLDQNYPNPFNPSTRISWQSLVSGYQTLKVYDVLGNEVATLVDEYKSAGSYEVEFNAANLPSGAYFYQLKAGDFIQTNKMILMK